MQSTAYNSQGQHVKVGNDNQDDIQHNYNGKMAKLLGVLQILCGTIILICQIVVTIFGSVGHQVFAGFWGSFFFILAGVFGIMSSQHKSRCNITVTLVFSILSAIFTAVAVAEGIIGAVIILIPNPDCGSEEESRFKDSQNNCEFDWRIALALALFLLMALLAFVEFIVAIMASVYCCHGCCNCCRNDDGHGAMNAYGRQQTTVQYSNDQGYSHEHNYNAHHGRPSPYAPPPFQ